MIEEAFFEIFGNIESSIKCLHSIKKRLEYILRDMKHKILDSKRPNLKLGMFRLVHPWICSILVPVALHEEGKEIDLVKVEKANVLTDMCARISDWCIDKNVAFTMGTQPTPTCGACPQ